MSTKCYIPSKTCFFGKQTSIYIVYKLYPMISHVCKDNENIPSRKHIGNSHVLFPAGTFESMIFPFPRWDTFPWRVRTSFDFFLRENSFPRLMMEPVESRCGFGAPEKDCEVTCGGKIHGGPKKTSYKYDEITYSTYFGAKKTTGKPIYFWPCIGDIT